MARFGPVSFFGEGLKVINRVGAARAQTVPMIDLPAAGAFLAYAAGGGANRDGLECTHHRRIALLAGLRSPGKGQCTK